MHWRWRLCSRRYATLVFPSLKLTSPWGRKKRLFTWATCSAFWRPSSWGVCAVGMTIADLTSGYVTSAPKTFLLKLCIGLIVGLVARRVFHLDREQRPRKRVLGTVVSTACGMAFNVVADPVVGYFYKTYVLGVPQDAAATWAKIGAVTTLVNAVVAVAVASAFYLALRPALEHAGLLKKAA